MGNPTQDYLDWKTWPEGSFGKFDQLEARYFAAETGISRDRSCRVLELGFGNGSFLGWARTQGAEVWAVETNPTLLQRACALLGNDRALQEVYDPQLDALPGTFTHIVAFDVLEHIPQEALTRLLRRLAELLSSEGRIILRFPNGDSPFGRINQHGDPTHVTTLGRGTLEYFARIAGLRAQELRAPAMPVSGVGFSRGVRRLAILLSRRLFERIAGILYLGGRKVPFDPNYTAVLIKAGPDDERDRAGVMRRDSPQLRGSDAVTAVR